MEFLPWDLPNQPMVRVNNPAGSPSRPLQGCASWCRSRGSPSDAPIWAEADVSSASAVGDHSYEDDSGLASAVLESGSYGFSSAVAGEPVPSEP
jgi:hypothetical protein